MKASVARESDLKRELESMREQLDQAMQAGAEARAALGASEDEIKETVSRSQGELAEALAAKAEAEAELRTVRASEEQAAAKAAKAEDAASAALEEKEAAQAAAATARADAEVARREAEAMNAALESVTKAAEEEASEASDGGRASPLSSPLQVLQAACKLRLQGNDPARSPTLQTTQTTSGTEATAPSTPADAETQLGQTPVTAAPPLTAEAFDSPQPRLPPTECDHTPQQRGSCPGAPAPSDAIEGGGGDGGHEGNRPSVDSAGTHTSVDQTRVRPAAACRRLLRRRLAFTPHLHAHRGVQACLSTTQTSEDVVAVRPEGSANATGTIVVERAPPMPLNLAMGLLLSLAMLALLAATCCASTDPFFLSGIPMGTIEEWRWVRATREAMLRHAIVFLCV
jgi:hypothetical protein